MFSIQPLPAMDLNSPLLLALAGNSTAQPAGPVPSSLFLTPETAEPIFAAYDDDDDEEDEDEDEEEDEDDLEDDEDYEDDEDEDEDDDEDEDEEDDEDEDDDEYEDGDDFDEDSEDEDDPTMNGRRRRPGYTF